MILIIEKEEETRHIEDTIKDVKSYHGGHLNPTSDVINLLHSFDLDLADPLPAIKKWTMKEFPANGDDDQVLYEKIL